MIISIKTNIFVTLIWLSSLLSRAIAVTSFTCGSTLSGGANYFPYTGSNCLATIPTSVSSIYIYMWGAGGGIGSGGTGGGGSGAYVEGSMPVTGGSTITVIVGQGAITCQSTSYFGGGGSCGAG